MWETELTLYKTKQLIIVSQIQIVRSFQTKRSAQSQAQENHYNYGSQQLQLRIVSTNQGKVYLTIATTQDVEQSASKI